MANKITIFRTTYIPAFTTKKMFLLLTIILLLLLLPTTHARPGQHSNDQRPHVPNTFPACSLSLFPYPTSVECGSDKSFATLSSSFQITFTDDPDAIKYNAMKSAVNRTLEQLRHLPHVISRGEQAEPGITPHNQSVVGAMKESVLQVVSLTINIAAKDISDKMLDTDESYVISIVREEPDSSSVVATISAPNMYGALYSMLTFVQLFRPQLSTDNIASPLSQPVVFGLPIHISDQPRFPWRGILLDTANHFFPLEDIQRTIRAMFANRYNVLHLHIVDSYSFPFASKSRPKLTSGAWTSKDVYTPDDLKMLKNVAMTQYGIRILLEVDMPGHAYSWGIGYPEIVANCPGYGNDIDIGHVNAVPLDPSSEVTYDVVEDVLREMLALVAPQEFVHLGGDEINIGCWNFTTSSNTTSKVIQWKEKNQYTWSEVIKFFYRSVWNRTIGSNDSPGGVRKVVTWEDLYLNRTTGLFDFDSPNVPFSNTEAIIEVWTNTKYLSDVVKAGYDGLYAAGWYLDRQQPVDGVVAWEWLDTMWQMYDIDPESDVVVENNKTLRDGRVLGGEASMWSEQVDTLTLDGRMWPRACTVAERLWSSRNVTDHEFAARRLRDHRCRLVKLWGVGAGPFWSDHCVGNS